MNLLEGLGPVDSLRVAPVEPLSHCYRSFVFPALIPNVQDCWWLSSLAAGCLVLD